MADDVSIRLRLLDRLRFQRDARLAQESVEDIGDEARRSSRLLATMGKVGSGVGRGLARGLKYAAVGGVTALAAVGAGAVKYASDLGESVSKANVIFGKHAKVVQMWSKGMAEDFGVSRAEALEASSGYMAMFKSAGVAAKGATEMSTSTAELAADMASMHNADPTEMLDKLRAGLSGEAEPLRRYGVFLSEAAVQQEAVRAGIAKAGAELTDAQKVQARYNIIMAQTKDAQGDVARTADSLPNVMRRLKASFKDTLAAIGGPLIKSVAPVMDVLGKVGPGIVEALGGPLEKIAQALGPLIEELLPAVAPLLTAFADVAVLVARALAPLLRMLGPVIQQVPRALMPAIEPLIAALRDGLLEVLRALGPHLPQLARSFAKILIALTPILPVLGRLIGLVLRVAGPVITGLVSALAWLIDKGLGPVLRFIERLSDSWASVWNGIKRVASAVWGAIAAGVRGFVNTIIAGVNWVIDKINAIQVHIHINPPGPGSIDFDWGGLNLPTLAEWGGGGGPGGATVTASGPQGRARGGPMTAWQPYWVGERGPELVVPRVGSTVVPTGGAETGGDGAGLGFGGGLNWYGDLIVQGTADPEETAERVIRKLRDKAARR